MRTPDDIAPDPNRPPDPAQADRAWAGYHPRAAVPAAAAAAVASLGVWTADLFIPDGSGLADQLGGWAVFVLAWGVWPALAGVFLYRTVCLTYRLTDRAVLVDFGPLYRPTPPLPLAAVTGVAVGGGWAGRRLGVGWVEVRAGGRTVRLTGVRDPAAFAGRVRAAAGAAEY